ncbi:hypothetical protein ACFZB6_31110 [Streptomyces syringium]|uniref:hypothetical protein n=1 Tax=Streptomyces syringium TaxID=76729 RepID=UPI0036E696D7
MTDWMDRLIADGVARVEELLVEEITLGALLWSVDGQRGYLRADADGSTVTVVGAPGKRTLRTVLVGVDAGCLR